MLETPPELARLAKGLGLVFAENVFRRRRPSGPFGSSIVIAHPTKLLQDGRGPLAGDVAERAAPPEKIGRLRPAAEQGGPIDPRHRSERLPFDEPLVPEGGEDPRQVALVHAGRSDNLGCAEGRALRADGRACREAFSETPSPVVDLTRL